MTPGLEANDTNSSIPPSSVDPEELRHEPEHREWSQSEILKYYAINHHESLILGIS